MRKSLFIIAILLISLSVEASHLVGGDMTYTCLGNNTYRIKLTIFRDCNNNQVPFDQIVPIAFYNNGFVYQSISVPITNVFPNIPLVADSCSPPPPSNVCVEYAEYIDTIVLPVSQFPYTIVHQRCCRNNVVMNIVAPASTGTSYHTQIPANDTACNSSVQFLDYPNLLLCFGQPNIIDIPTSDPDGDSLVFSLCAPMLGGGQAPGTVMPSPPSGPPYTPVSYTAGFSPATPINGSPGMSINPQTGTITVFPDPVVGFFTVGVCVDEYRNGQLINSVTREMQFIVADCILSTQAGIRPQAEIAAETKCIGRTIQFQHFSSGMLEAMWIFNDPGNAPNDTSTSFNPIYTFSDTGFYEVMLVINSGIPGCIDTAIEIFEIRDSVDNWFTWGDSPCLDKGLTFEMHGSNLVPQASIEWNFGVNATPQTWSGPDPPPISFTNDGNPYEVTLTTEQFGCSSFYYEQLQLFDRISFDVTGLEDEGCAPYEAEINSNARARGTMQILWDMDDGTTYRNTLSVSHTYSDPGVYRPTIQIQTNTFCIDTVNINLSPITIKTGAEVLLNASARRLLMYDPSVTFSITVGDDVNYTELHTGDGQIFSPSPDRLNHTYDADSAHFVAFLIGENEMGCFDTSFVDIYVVPETNIFIPNAFRPNGNGLNDFFEIFVTNVLEYNLQIFNRWGQRVFSSESPTVHWDGSVNGKPAPIGTYVYKLDLKDQQGEWHYRTGSVNLIR